jgi:hypothetical protein
MCRGSPRSRLASADRTRTASEQLLKGVDPRSVPIAPVDAQAVGADQLDRHRADIGRDHGRIKQWSPAHFLDTAGTGARQAK